MKHKPMPLAVALSGLLYWGLLVYWVSDDLQAGSDAAGGQAAMFGLVFSIIYVGYLIACLKIDMPDPKIVLKTFWKSN